MRCINASSRTAQRGGSIVSEACSRTRCADSVIAAPPPGNCVVDHDSWHIQRKQRVVKVSDQFYTTGFFMVLVVGGQDLPACGPGTAIPDIVRVMSVRRPCSCRVVCPRVKGPPGEAAPFGGQA